MDTCNNCKEHQGEIYLKCHNWYTNKSVEFMLCSQKCVDNIKNIFTCKCSMCKNIINKKPIKCNVPKGGKKFGNSYTIFFCSNLCKEAYFIKLCHICHGDYELTIINSKLICSDNTSFTSLPSCKEQFTGIYKCNFCKKERKVDETPCYYFEDDTLENINICQKCIKIKILDIKPQDFKYYVNKNWIYVQENNIHYKKLLELYDRNCEYDFICNKCNIIKKVNTGIFIFENKNLCEDCYF